MELAPEDRGPARSRSNARMPRTLRGLGGDRRAPLKHGMLRNTKI
ncbi:hypothetical protein [Pseudocowpox virus]